MGLLLLKGKQGRSEAPSPAIQTAVQAVLDAAQIPFAVSIVSQVSDDTVNTRWSVLGLSSDKPLLVVLANVVCRLARLSKCASMGDGLRALSQ